MPKFRVVTRNSVYQVAVTENGFAVARLASTFGQRVNDRKSHVSPTLEITLGRPMVTTVLRTTPVLAILPA